MGLGQRGRGLIVVDSSAVVAILLNEPDAGRLAHRLSADPGARAMSAASYVEAGTVLAGRRDNPVEGMADLDIFLRMTGVVLIPVDDTIARLALEARVRWGKGFGTRKGLNFGDSFAYATAAALKAPLLFTGDDFSVTDIEPALGST